ncbi:hypothetical protein KAF44_42255 [Cupriavidus necator]|nr:hypothetical protein KAF44_42255 [Cupriavidus necator]
MKVAIERLETDSNFGVEIDHEGSLSEFNKEFLRGAARESPLWVDKRPLPGSRHPKKRGEPGSSPRLCPGLYRGLQPQSSVIFPAFTISA